MAPRPRGLDADAHRCRIAALADEIDELADRLVALSGDDRFEAGEADAATALVVQTLADRAEALSEAVEAALAHLATTWSEADCSAAVVAEMLEHLADAAGAGAMPPWASRVPMTCGLALRQVAGMLREEAGAQGG